MTSSRTFDVAIVGGGASGTLLAIQLLIRARRQLQLLLLDRCGDFGRGLAYRTLDPSHVVNVPAARMSALPESEGHFLSWLRRRDGTAGPETYVLRHVYGDYLLELLGEAERRAPKGSRLERRQADVADVETVPRGVRLRLLPDTELNARHAVLALGNPPPVPLAVSPAGSLRVWQSPWPRDADWPPPEASVLLVGAGLTAVDVLLSLCLRGHRGPVHVLSRHGFLPNAHGAHTLKPLALKLPRRRLRPLVRAVRAAADGASSDWRPVIDGVRLQAEDLWTSLSDAERRRFSRHVRTLWEVHRHRLAPAVAAQVNGLLASRQLRVHAGHLVRVVAGASSVQATFRPRGTAQLAHLDVDLAVNCTGPAGHASKPDALVSALLQRGLAVPGPLGLGLATDGRGAILGRSGKGNRRLWTLGPVRRGDVWESTAIPDIRSQAAELAKRLAP